MAGKLLNIKVIIFSIMLFFSCSNEIGQNIRVVEDVTLFVELNLSEEDVPITKGETFDDEQISEIDLVIFKREGRKEIFYKHEIINDFQEVQTPNGLQKGFEVKLDKEIIDPIYGARLMVFTNCHDNLENFLTTVNNTTERIYFHENMLVDDYGWKNTSKHPFTKMSMCGITAKIITASEIVNNETITIDLIRAFARVDIGVDINKSTSPLREYFKLKNVYVLGTNSNYLIPRHYQDPLAPIVSRPNLPIGAAIIRDIDFRHKYPYTTNNGNIMQGVIYITESKALDNSNPFEYNSIDENGISQKLTVSQPTVEPYNGVFLIIEADYKEFNNRYYRIDFASPNGYFSINRNSLYEINIQDVSHEGKATLEEAMKQAYLTKSPDSYTGLNVEISVK